MNESELITGSVAEVLNSREIIINRGSDSGVKEGLTFEVFAPQGENVIDPETGDNLGSVNRPKVVVRIVHVEPRLSVGRTFRSTRRNIGGNSAIKLFDKMFEPPQYVREYDTLRMGNRTWEEIDESESIVKIGDPVRQTLKYDEE